VKDIKLSLEERKGAAKKGIMAVQCNVDGKFFRNIWDLPEKACTPEVMKALEHAVKVGVDIAKEEMKLTLWRM